MRRLAHGYTNDTILDGDIVVKTYAGPDVVERQERETSALRRLSGRLPVPTVVDSVSGALSTRYVAGHHGQDLIDAGFADAVLSSCGRMLRRLQEIPSETAGAFLVHGDFGPNNLLLTADGSEVVLLADWEWSTFGGPLLDLAWCEWIVRMHHAEHVDSLLSLFDAYGDRPPWRQRQHAMLDRCAEILDFDSRWPGSRSAELWRQRTAEVTSWRELPA